MKKHFFFLLMAFAVFLSAGAQKIISEGTIVYRVSVTNGITEPGIAEAFDGATQTLWLKGDDVRLDFSSAIRKQITLFKGNEGTAVILKESGADKYMMGFDKMQWQHYNRKYEGISYSDDPETREIAGYTCKKAIARLKDGSVMTIFYTPDIEPRFKTYDYAFKDLAGTPLEYEVNSGKITINYKAVSVQFQPVGISKFDLPKSGYKILQYKQ